MCELAEKVTACFVFATSEQGRRKDRKKVNGLDRKIKTRQLISRGARERDALGVTADQRIIVGDGLSWDRSAARRRAWAGADPVDGDGSRELWPTMMLHLSFGCTHDTILDYPSCVGLCVGKRRRLFLERLTTFGKSVYHDARLLANFTRLKFYEGVIKGLAFAVEQPAKPDRQSEKRILGSHSATTWKRMRDRMRYDESYAVVIGFASGVIEGAWSSFSERSDGSAAG